MNRKTSEVSDPAWNQYTQQGLQLILNFPKQAPSPWLNKYLMENNVSGIPPQILRQ